MPNPQDPLPPYILGGLDSSDFLDAHLNQVTHPLVAGLGLLSNSTLNNSAWSVGDVSNSSFHAQVNRLMSIEPSPTLAPDIPRMIPHKTTRKYTTRGVQVTTSGRSESADVTTETVTLTRVSVHFHVSLQVVFAMKISTYF